MPEISESDRQKVMHVVLPLPGDVEIMGTDMLESMGHHIKIGNNVSTNLEPNTIKETDRLYNCLSEGAIDCMPRRKCFGRILGRVS